MRKISTKVITGALTLSIAFTSVLNPVQISRVSAKSSVTADAIVPQKATYGYYVDVYKNNETSNMTPETNPSIGVLSGFLEVFTPGEAWNTGTVVNEQVHEANLKATAKIAGSRTKEMEEAAYLDDRRNQNYSMISGLGPYADAFIKGTEAGTTIADQIPKDAASVKYEDGGNANGSWAETNSDYGNMVNLVNVIRGTGASTSSAKAYYKYMRPFRWTEEVQVEDILIPCKKSDPSNDGGFPSGHTNAAYLAAYGLAYAMPERYQELITRASELGNNRIVAGMHSCLDVIGGRVMATAVAAAALNDPANKKAKQNAYADARNLLKDTKSGTDDYANYETNKKKNLERLTYGLLQTGDRTKEMVVPKGAEVLLETRLPYLDAEARRYVLYTTGLESGYPVLDDTEGWGRLNLFEAANGYGAFVTDVTVNMDAAKGGYHAADEWKNDIDGKGALTKQGTGTLRLSGKNSYTGGTTVAGGTVVAKSETALGNSGVVNGAKLSEDTKSKVIVNGNYTQKEGASLIVSISGKQDIIAINGDANLNGTLSVTFEKGVTPADHQQLISYKSNTKNTKFSKLEVKGVSNAYEWEIVYAKDGVYLCKKEEQKPAVTQKTQKITTSKSSYTKTYGDHAFSLGAKTTGKGTVLRYYSSDTSVAKVDHKSGKVSIKGYGKATITIKASANAGYKEAVKKVTVTVKPVKAKITAAKRLSNTKIKVSWKKDTKATGYEIRYKYKNSKKKWVVKTVAVTKAKTTTRTLTKLKSRQGYYVSVRAYKKVGSQKLYGVWSDSKKIK